MNIMTKRGTQDNIVTFQHICDTRADLPNIPPEYITLGSVAVVLCGPYDCIEVYMATSDKRWILLTLSYGGESSSTDGIDLSHDTVDILHLIEGYTAHDKDGNAITGTVPVRTINNLIQSGNIIMVPGGYYNQFTINLNLTKVPSKDVDFYDFDGTRLYSYTKDEFLALTEMPPNLSEHDFLITDDWSYSLAEAQAYVQKYGILDIGQLYTTQDQKTYIFIHIKQPTNVIITPSTADLPYTINWGDNTTIYEGAPLYSSQFGVQVFQHQYTTIGDYIIQILPTGVIAYEEQIDFNLDINDNKIITQIYYGPYLNTINMENAYNIQYVAFDKNNNKNISNLINCSKLKALILCQGIQFQALTNCISLETICLASISHYHLDIDSNLGFYLGPNVNKLQRITFPDGVYELTGDFGFPSNLSNFTIPESTMLVHEFRNSHIEKLVIPENILYLKNGVFTFNYELKEIHVFSSFIGSNNYFNGFFGFPNIHQDAQIHFYSTTPPILIENPYAFQETNTIYVPYSADHSILNAYKTATNWVVFANQIFEQPAP